MRMVLKRRGISEVHVCSCVFNILPRVGVVPLKEAKIPIYYSVLEAKKAGWMMTDHIKYCPPEASYAWVCPKCAAKETWINDQT